MQQLAKGRSYSKKKGRTIGNNSLIDGTGRSNSSSSLFFKKVVNEVGRMKKGEGKGGERGGKGRRKSGEEKALLAFLKEKKQFFDSFDTTCLATTPMKN